MAVHYKFKSAKEFDSIAIEGHFISVAQLKERILEKMKLGRAADFDLVVSNFQTNEEYADEGFLVPRNTSLLIKRVPATAARARFIPEVKQPEVKPVPEASSMNMNQAAKPAVQAWSDDFGVDLYEQPEAPKPVPPPSTDRLDEEARIKAFCDMSASDWQRQTQEAYIVGGPGRGFNRGAGRGMGGRMIGFRKTPPDGYVCHRCNKPGHYIQHCPTNGDPSYNIKKVKLPTGIPRTMLVANPDGSYALPNGEVAALKPNEDVFEKEVNALTASKAVNEIPQELRCPLCRGVLKDAVLTSKCCFKSYCDSCIRNEILRKGRCVCGETNVLADSLLPNRTLRDAIDRLLDSNPAGSADIAGSKQNVPEMESASPFKKVPSPTASASLKEPQVVQQPNGVDGNANEAIASPQEAEQVANQDGAVDSAAKTDEDAQQQQQLPGKKNKPKRSRPSKQGMPGQPMWRGMDGMEDGHMGFPGANQGPYPGMWPAIGGDGYMENYMMPYGGPFNGYGGMAPVMAADPYYQGIAPVPPFPQRDYMEYGSGFDYDYSRSVMTREEFEAKKAEARRKQSSSSDHRDRDHADERDKEDSSRRKRSREEYGHRRESSRERRSSRHEEARRSSRHHDGHSSGDEERHPSRHSRYSSHRSDEDYYRHRSSAEEKRAASSSSSYRNAAEDHTAVAAPSKRRKEEVEEYEDKHRASHSSSSKRVSVFLRVKQNGAATAAAEEETSSAADRKRRPPRHESIETDNEISVFNRLATNPKAQHHHSSRGERA